MFRNIWFLTQTASLAAISGLLVFIAILYALTCSNSQINSCQSQRTKRLMPLERHFSSNCCTGVPIFTSELAYSKQCKRWNCYDRDVRPSVCLSVTLWYCIKRDKNGVMISQLSTGYCHFGWLVGKSRRVSVRAINRSTSTNGALRYHIY